jgi:hypothetical protein
VPACLLASTGSAQKNFQFLNFVDTKLSTVNPQLGQLPAKLSSLCAGRKIPVEAPIPSQIFFPILPHCKNGAMFCCAKLNRRSSPPPTKQAEAASEANPTIES